MLWRAPRQQDMSQINYCQLVEQIRNETIMTVYFYVLIYFIPFVILFWSIVNVRDTSIAYTCNKNTLEFCVHTVISWLHCFGHTRVDRHMASVSHCTVFMCAKSNQLGMFNHTGTWHHCTTPSIHTKSFSWYCHIGCHQFQLSSPFDWYCMFTPRPLFAEGLCIIISKSYCISSYALWTHLPIIKYAMYTLIVCGNNQFLKERLILWTNKPIQCFLIILLHVIPDFIIVIMPGLGVILLYFAVETSKENWCQFVEDNINISPSCHPE